MNTKSIAVPQSFNSESKPNTRESNENRFKMRPLFLKTATEFIPLLREYQANSDSSDSQRFSSRRRRKKKYQSNSYIDNLIEEKLNQQK